MHGLSGGFFGFFLVWLFGDLMRIIFTQFMGRWCDPHSQPDPPSTLYTEHMQGENLICGCEYYCSVSWWWPFSLRFWLRVQKTSACSIQAALPTKLIGFPSRMVSHLCKALSKCSKRFQPWAPRCSMWLSSCSHPSREVACTFTYLCVQSRPGKLLTITWSSPIPSF